MALLTEGQMGDADDKQSDNTKIFVVGIGASAGGLEALEKFFDHISSESGMAYVVVQHLSPDFKSLMDELLARHTKLPIIRVEGKTKVRPNAIFLIPPKKNMELSEGHLLLTDQDASGGLNLPIDMFFRSLAKDAGDHSVAIILSGTGSDGSRGVCDVHHAGGLVLAQNANSAGFDGMPRSAIGTGVVDAVLEVSEMADFLMSYASEPKEFLRKYSREENQIAPGGELQHIFRLFRNRFGIDFTLYRSNTIQRRIDRRMQLQRCESLAEYAILLDHDVAELDLLYRDLLVEVTQFFRDPQAFDLLRKEIIPKIVADAKGERDEIRVWVPGCATGEEAYSIAMLFDAAIIEAKQRTQIKVFATDVHSTSLETAATGVYSSESMVNVPSDLRTRYFIRHGNVFQVSRELRKSVIFAPHDITKDPPFTKIDLLSCRNVLIYLDTHVQTRVVSLFHFGLKVGGTMMLGPSESIGDLSREFETVDQHWRVFRKLRDIRLPDSKTMSSSPALTSIVRERPRYGGTARIETSLESAVVDDLLERYVPPSMLVNQHYELVHSFGEARKLLIQPRGAPTLEVLRMVEGDLKMALSSALYRATREKQRVVMQGVRMGADETKRLVQVVVEPYIKRNRDLFLVCLEEMEEVAQPADPSVEQFDATDQAQQRIVDLERELEYIKESLQATVEELESSNEELQSTNEELVASNEELQSTNEELHSVNEELFTVNAEHQHKIEELTQLTSDMDNLLLSTEIGTIFLDRQLRIRKFTPAIKTAFNILDQDIGRPIDQFAYHLENSDILSDAKEVLQTDKPVERNVMGRDGRVYLQRIQPYRVASGESNGVVVTVTDVSSVVKAEAEEEQRKRLEQMAGELQDFAYSVSHDLKAPIRQVLGFSRSLKESCASSLDEDQLAELGILAKGAERLNDLLDCLLDYSRVNTRGAKPRLTEIGDLVDEVITDMSDEIDAAKSMVTRGRLPKVLVDQTQMRYVFGELIRNALKFSSNPQQIEISAYRDGDEWEFTVQDQGDGIREQHLDDVFVVFRRFLQRREVPGNGTGLAICKRIIERHRGRIWVESSVGEGTAVKFRLAANDNDSL